MAKITREECVNFIVHMTIKELLEFIEELKEKFNLPRV